MNIKITTKGKFTVPANVETRLKKKLSKLDKFFQMDTEAYVILSFGKGNEATAEVTITHKGMIYRAQGKASDMIAAVDAVAALLERQIIENKSRLAKRLKEGAFSDEADTENLPEEKFDLIRTKHFQVKPMDVEEAILQMNLLGHSFFVFRSIDSDEISVVYRRTDGGFGLIEPTK